MNTATRLRDVRQPRRQRLVVREDFGARYGGNPYKGDLNERQQLAFEVRPRRKRPQEGAQAVTEMR